MKIAVFVERNLVTGKLRDVSVELAHKAAALVGTSGEVVGLYVGGDLPSNTEDLFRYGMNRLVFFKHENLTEFQSMAYKHVMLAMIKQENPDIVLVGATHNGREVAPLISSSLGTGLTADCTQLHIDDYKDKGRILYQVRPAFGGNILATIITPDHRPMMATVRENVLQLTDKKANNPIRLEEFKFTLDRAWLRSEFLAAIPKDRGVNLQGTEVIVAGGAGVGSKDGFGLIEALARAMGGEVAASRAAVDFGYIGKERMVGQTGQVVRPRLYVACGISGSIQHRAGMEESRKIIAINSDPNAPIFKIAHMGIVGDLKEVIPVMLKYLQEASE